MSTKELVVACFCSLTTHTFVVPTALLPLHSHLCSCNISRRTSGSLLTSYINVTHPTLSNPSPPRPDTSCLTSYDSSNILRRWFCTTCGTHMFLEYHVDGHFEAATGTLQVGDLESTDEIVQFRSCMWINDTKDGGGSKFVTYINKNPLKRYAHEAHISDELPLNWYSSPPPSSPSSRGKQAEAIYAHCHCKAIEFYITPPTLDSSCPSKTSSPFPDLLVPYHLNQSANPKNFPWWLPTPSKYLAGTCTCRSCRRASGFDLTFWAFIPTANIFLDAQLTQPFKLTWGSMKSFTSSPGVTRTFCSRCGANAFWSGSKDSFGREGLVDVAVGLLDAKSGARAEERLAWWPRRVSFREFAIHEELVRSLEGGLRDWAETSDGRECVAVYDGEILGVDDENQGL
ncbi:Mss4-like protein [Phaeosphaeriaceae sp. PMI808]|nr:Mss4-like protein [Phaeosphaeriaceae sp. PMI808]